jgi:hypothetical protein
VHASVVGKTDMNILNKRLDLNYDERGKRHADGVTLAAKQLLLVTRRPCSRRSAHGSI